MVELVGFVARRGSLFQVHVGVFVLNYQDFLPPGVGTVRGER
jgi:hypothetical protein